MTETMPAPEEFLPLTPAMLHILLALAGGERHGYAIMQEIERFTDGSVRLGPATLYRSIRGLLGGRLIEESDERPDPRLDDERRRYYRLTALGQRALQLEVQRLAKLVRMAERTPLLQGRLLGMESN